jgi:hypothetical protein
MARAFALTGRRRGSRKWCIVFVIFLMMVVVVVFGIDGCGEGCDGAFADADVFPDADLDSLVG